MAMHVLQLRNVCLYVLSYAGFFRSEEVLNIRVSHIRFYEGFMTIKVDKSKTDQLRQGDTTKWLLLNLRGMFAQLSYS